jgi:hypothetical protein
MKKIVSRETMKDVLIHRRGWRETFIVWKDTARYID